MNILTQLAQINSNDLKLFGNTIKPIDPKPGGPFSGDNPLVSVVWNVVGSLFIIAVYGFLLAMLVGGVQYLFSAGNDEAIGRSKKTFTNATIGLVVVFASYQILTFIINRFGVAVQSGSIAMVVGEIYNIVLGLAGAVFLILLAIGGFMYLVGGTNDEQLQKAKKMLTSSLIGIALVAFAFGIGKTILILFNIPIIG